jgi:hypothetical protein
MGVTLEGSSAIRDQYEIARGGVLGDAPALNESEPALLAFQLRTPVDIPVGTGARTSVSGLGRGIGPAFLLFQGITQAYQNHVADQILENAGYTRQEVERLIDQNVSADAREPVGPNGSASTRLVYKNDLTRFVLETWSTSPDAETAIARIKEGIRYIGNPVGQIQAENRQYNTQQLFRNAAQNGGSRQSMEGMFAAGTNRRFLTVYPQGQEAKLEIADAPNGLTYVRDPSGAIKAFPTYPSQETLNQILRDTYGSQPAPSPAVQQPVQTRSEPVAPTGPTPEELEQQRKIEQQLNEIKAEGNATNTLSNLGLTGWVNNNEHSGALSLNRGGQNLPGGSANAQALEATFIDKETGIHVPVTFFLPVGYSAAQKVKFVSDLLKGNAYQLGTLKTTDRQLASSGLNLDRMRDAARRESTTQRQAAPQDATRLSVPVPPGTNVVPMANNPYFMISNASGADIVDGSGHRVINNRPTNTISPLLQGGQTEQKPVLPSIEPPLRFYTTPEEAAKQYGVSADDVRAEMARNPGLSAEGAAQRIKGRALFGGSTGTAGTPPGGGGNNGNTNRTAASPGDLPPEDIAKLSPGEIGRWLNNRSPEELKNLFEHHPERMEAIAERLHGAFDENWNPKPGLSSGEATWASSGLYVLERFWQRPDVQDLWQQHAVTDSLPTSVILDQNGLPINRPPISQAATPTIYGPNNQPANMPEVPQTETPTIYGPNNQPYNNPAVPQTQRVPQPQQTQEPIIELPPQQPIDLTSPGPAPLTADRIQNLAQTIRSLPANEAQRARGPLLYILSYGQIPSNWHDIHAHNGGFWGTYDPQYADRNPRSDRYYMSRLTSMLGNGKSMQFYFPVAPQIRGQIPGFEGRTVFGSNTPGYYQALTGLFRNPLVGRVVLKGDTAQVQEPLKDAYGQTVVPRLTMSRQNFETLIGRTIPRDVNEVQFVPTPIDCNLHYQGVGADQRSISQLAAQVRFEQQAFDGVSPSLRSHFVGLTGGNPYAENSSSTIYDGLRFANREELRNNLSVGTLNVGNMGEITFDKEAVTMLSGGKPILSLGDEDKARADNFVSPMRYAGGVTIIHADIGRAVTTQLPGTDNYQTFIQPNQYENFNAIYDFFRRNPNQQFIWAHAGASASQFAEHPREHIAFLRRMLELPNVKIDLSWTATNKEIIADPDAWAELIRDYPTRFIWGSDTIAASHKVDSEAIKAPMKQLEKQGFLERLDRIRPGLKEQFLAGNFEQTLPPAQARVNQWRSHPLVQQWLANGGYENGTPPPMQWVKRGNNWDSQDDWELVPNPAAYNTDRPWWNEGQQPGDIPRVPTLSQPLQVTPRIPEPSGDSTLARRAGQALWHALRPQGWFIGVSSPVGSGFAIIPRKTITQNLNVREITNVEDNPDGAFKAITWYGSSPAIHRWRMGGFEVVAQVVGTASPKGGQEGGVQAFISHPVPGGGKVGFFLNTRQDWVTAEPLIRNFVRYLAGQSALGIPSGVSEFGNGRLPEGASNSLSVNFGPMYTITPHIIQLISLQNPAMGAILEGARRATGTDIWIGGGWRGDLNFFRGNLNSIRINDTMIPPDQLRGVIQGGDEAIRNLVGGVNDRLSASDFAAARQLSTRLFGTSPFDSLSNQIVPSTGQPLDFRSGFNGLTNAEKAVAPIYMLGREYNVLRPGDIVTRENVASTIEAILERVQAESPQAYESAIRTLTGKYNLDFGSQTLREYLNQPGHYNLGYVQGDPRDYEDVRRQFGQ